MSEALQAVLEASVDAESLAVLGRALVLVVVGFGAAYVLRGVAYRTVARVLSEERAVLVRRVVFYGVSGLALASALTELGFDLTVLVGAAGILTVALGFASQTSASNIISGLFLIGEQPFSVGDWVQIGTSEGEVLAIDLLSVKLRTAQNLYVRVPNETVMKGEIVNYTRFPIRRLDLLVTVPFDADLDAVRTWLMDLGDAHPRVLDEPRPMVRFTRYGESGVDLVVAYWVVRTEFLDLKDALSVAVKRELERHGVVLPFPHRRVVLVDESGVARGLLPETHEEGS